MTFCGLPAALSLIISDLVAGERAVADRRRPCGVDNRDVCVSRRRIHVMSANGDGKADILWRNSTTGQVYIWLMNGTTLTSSGSLGSVSSDWSIAGVGDFDGNGTSDMLWRNSTTGQVYIWFINGTTMSGGGSVSYVTSDWVIQGVGDYYGSGRAGILWRNSSTEQVYIWLMNDERDHDWQHRQP